MADRCRKCGDFVQMSGSIAAPETVMAQNSAAVYGACMSDYAADSTPTALRFKANACRVVAETSDSPERKAIWLKRAQQWEELALKTAERQLESIKSQKT